MNFTSKESGLIGDKRMTQNEINTIYDLYDNYCTSDEMRCRLKFDDMELKSILEKHKDCFSEEQRSYIIEIADPFKNATVGDVYDVLSERIYACECLGEQK